MLSTDFISNMSTILYFYIFLSWVMINVPDSCNAVKEITVFQDSAPVPEIGG